MTKAVNHGGCWPTSLQELLLRAALLDGENAIDAWEEWRSRVDADQLDLGSERLLPLVYRNLVNRNVKDPVIGKLKAVYRRTWRDNQLLFHRVSGLLRSFCDAGIETIVLKGAALALLHYKDSGLRPMNDFDVMVRVEQMAAAIDVMRKHGWKPMPRSPEAVADSYLSVVNSHGFTHASGVECDLQSNLRAVRCRR